MSALCADHGITWPWKARIEDDASYTGMYYGAYEEN